MGDAEPVPAERVKGLLGRVPSKADRERLSKVRDALGTRSTDAVWDIMIALDYHLQLYAGAPDKIAEQPHLAAAELGRNVEGAKRKERSGCEEVVASVGAPKAVRARPRRWGRARGVWWNLHRRWLSHGGEGAAAVGEDATSWCRALGAGGMVGLVLLLPVASRCRTAAEPQISPAARS